MTGDRESTDTLLSYLTRVFPFDIRRVGNAVDDQGRQRPAALKRIEVEVDCDKMRDVS
jgi:hypothetical protein